MGRHVGIDFGTTNSSIAIVGEPSSRPTLARFEHARGTTDAFRSVLHFEGASHTPGPPPGLAGPRAIERHVDLGGRLIQSLKSYLASRLFTSTNVFGTVFTLEELIAIILRQLKSEAERQFGAIEGTVVFGRPVRFVNLEDGDDAEFPLTRMRAAARLAGFDRVEFEYEPVGAAYFYESTLDHDELLLVADFGGGTSDFCLLRAGPNLRRSGEREILGTEGVGIAGDAFDARIVDHAVSPRLGAGSAYRSYMDGKEIPLPPWIFAKLRRWHHLSFLKSRETMSFLREVRATAIDREAIDALLYVIDQELGFSLYRSVEATKLGLSSAERVRFGFCDGPVDIERDVGRGEFEGWIANETDAIAQCVDRLLTRTGVAARDVDRVFMTGGSSLLPAARRLFEQRFGREKLTGGNELTSVAAGLALRAADLAATKG